VLIIEHSTGVFSHRHPKSLSKLPHLQYVGGDVSRPYFEIRLPDGQVETLRFGDLEEAMETERRAEDAIYPEPNYS